jgi:hypothetical protein
MKENQLLLVNEEKEARDPCWQLAPNLLNAGAQIVDERHP